VSDATEEELPTRVFLFCAVANPSHNMPLVTKMEKTRLKLCGI
jgi:hypothetical protein